MKTNPLQIILVLLVALVLPKQTPAQLKANFIIDKIGGCAPFTANFTNKTEGASANAVYNWDFGNGNSSSLFNCGAVFLKTKIYTVTLTVEDSNKVSVKTQSITVYNKPIVDFTASVQQGCATLPVTFTSIATSAGTIANYYWDFGDGSTAENNNPLITHSYLYEQKPVVTLAVTDNYGCANYKTINNLVTVLPGLKADFDADKTFICFITDAVKMINKSTGTGTLTYFWNFGDGTSSTQKEPVHAFNKKGIFSIQLIVQNAGGCSDTLVKTAFLNVGNFTSSITLPASICKNAPVEIINSSSPAPDSYTWLVDGTNNLYYDWENKQKYNFTTAGTHTIKLTNTYGNCIDTVVKIIAIKELLQPKGFTAILPVYCFLPVNVAFHDTTTGAVITQWNFDRRYDPLPFNATGKDVSYNFTQSNNWLVTLFVTDIYGCTDSIERYVLVDEPRVTISSTDGLGLEACLTLTKNFHFSSNVPLTSYKWNFGDGATDTAADAQHTFTPGTYRVTLTYTTTKGCVGKSFNYWDITVYPKPHAEFTSLSGTTICGNSMVKFQTVGGTIYDYWIIDSQFLSSSNYGQKYYQFQDTGKHTVTLIAYNGSGKGCYDTMTRVNYISVLAPFPKISVVKNTCDGNRGMVTFTQTSRYAKKWVWNFGDNSALVTLDADVATIQHTYLKTGTYMVTLSTINGDCTVKDSIYCYVLLKQNPLLAAVKTTVCLDEGLIYTITNFEYPPYLSNWVWNYVNYYQFNDGKKDSVSFGEDANWIYTDIYTNTFTNLVKGATSIRIITKNFYFNCYDTTNYIPIKIIGAEAGFSILKDTICYGTPIILKDTSNSYNTTITNRQWNFGDGVVLNSPPGSSTTSHLYTEPGIYTISLKITDSSGCSSTTSLNSHQVVINGPKAAFTTVSSNVQLNTNVQFVNTSNEFNSITTNYSWIFGDGRTSSEYSPAHTFTTPGNYVIKLIAKSTTTGCSDTAFKSITVKNFNVGFTFEATFLNTSSCLPILVQFKNTSTNYVKLAWDFGDGNTAENTEYPSHLYTAAGVYKITLLVTGYNGLSDVYTDSITIKKNDAAIKANQLHSCTAQSITLSAISLNATNYLWDFGDGTLAQATDTFAVHYYATAGIYTPTLIVKDTDGCEASASITEKIIIDSLHLALDGLPQNICTPKTIYFNPTVINIAADQALQKLIYHWDFGTGNKADTANTKNSSFVYQTPGTYTINLKVQSPFGCIKNVQTTISAKQGLGAIINGPAAICAETKALFTGSTQLPGQPKWHWIFDDGTTADQQNPPARLYNMAGNFLVKLIADNNGCADTITSTLKVVAKPSIVLSASAAILCEGSQRSITASGGDTYSWSPSTGLNNTSSATVIANPVTNTTYNVTVTNSFGCSNTGTVVITVVHPFTLKSINEYFVCNGKTVSLNVSGANTYQWINNTLGLNNTIIANPLSTPKISTIYTVVGTDINNCFRDTADIKVTVQTIPTVNAGQGALILAGTSYQLQATASYDVVQWAWTPAQYLSCSNCAAPVTTPLAPLLYTVTVTNANGCTAYDTVSINILCSESRIFIPKAFTPDNDGVNDLFVIKGAGIKIVNHLRIYDRYGGLVFERNNFSIGDVNAAWDGRHNGAQVSPGAYVYIAEMSCNEKTFVQKGTVTVIY